MSFYTKIKQTYLQFDDLFISHLNKTIQKINEESQQNCNKTEKIPKCYVKQFQILVDTYIKLIFNLISNKSEQL